MFKTARDISIRHHEIIDEWSKAWLSEIYRNGKEIKPSCFTLVQQQPTFENGKMVTKYWAEPKDTIDKYEFDMLSQCVVGRVGVEKWKQILADYENLKEELSLTPYFQR